MVITNKDKYIKCDTIKLPNGKNRILYRKPKSSTLYIKHNGKMIYYSTFKRKYAKQSGGIGGTGELCVLDYYILDENGNDVQIAGDFEQRIATKIAGFANLNYTRHPVTTSYEVHDGTQSLSYHYDIDEDVDKLEFSFKIENEESYKKTLAVLKKKIKDLKKLYLSNFEPLLVFVSKDENKKPNAFVICTKHYAIHLNLIEDTNKIKFLVSHIEYFGATIHNLEMFMIVNRNNQWKKIYDNGIHSAKIDAVRDAHLQRPAGRETIGYIPRPVRPGRKQKTSTATTVQSSEHTMQTLNPHLVNMIFSFAQSSDYTMNNRQLAIFMYETFSS